MNSLLAAMQELPPTPPNYYQSNPIPNLIHSVDTSSPKRRRRTSKDELAMLEAHFKTNPLPTVLQRAEIAAQVGLSVRATQVWFQNRRQKGKKETGINGISHPHSAPDGPSSDARYSSSTSPPPMTRYKPYIIPKTFTTSTKPIPKFPILTSSQDLYAGIEKKEIAITSWRQEIIPHPSMTSIAPDGSILIARARPTYPNKVPPPVSVIQQIKKEEISQLGSKAPTARKSELLHEFLFPPSPIKLPTPPASLHSPTVLSFPFPSSPRANSVPAIEKRPSLTEFITRNNSYPTPALKAPKPKQTKKTPPSTSTLPPKSLTKSKLKLNKLSRSHSLGGLISSTITTTFSPYKPIPSTSSTTPILPVVAPSNILKLKNYETSRAGPNETCALTALGRKRALMDFSTTTSSAAAEMGGKGTGKRLKRGEKENVKMGGKDFGRSKSEPFGLFGAGGNSGVVEAGEEERQAASLLLGLFGGMF